MTVREWRGGRLPDQIPLGRRETAHHAARSPNGGVMRRGTVGTEKDHAVMSDREAVVAVIFPRPNDSLAGPAVPLSSSSLPAAPPLLVAAGDLAPVRYVRGRRVLSQSQLHAQVQSENRSGFLA